jgi:endo-1,4-beta-xylanase
MGVGASDPTQLSDPQYAKLAAQYNAIEPGNVMKMPTLEPSNGVYNFTKTDQVVSFAVTNGQHVTATAPLWFDSIPNWVLNGGYTGVQLDQIMHDYILAIMQHYRDKYPGVVDHWSIVSEATHGSGIWSNIPGTGIPGLKVPISYTDNGAANTAWIIKAYQYARQADPSVKLCYDDYGGEGTGGVSADVYTIVSYLKSQGLLDCVGLEGQWEGSGVKGIPSTSSIISNINQLGALGLDVYFSQMEIGVPSSDGVSANNPADLITQGNEYGALLSACLSTTACKAFYTWGLSDKYAFCWNPGWCAPLPYDSNFNPKPAYDALAAALKAPH